MNSIVSKVLFPTTSRALSIATRNIFTKEYLGLTFVERKEKEAHSKAGKNVVKIKECLMKTYNQDGIKGLKKNEILFFMHLVDSEKDMANLCRMVEGYLGNATPDLERPRSKKLVLTPNCSKGQVGYSHECYLKVKVRSFRSSFLPLL